MASLRPLLVIAGLGAGGGTGAATARLFAKEGYSIALIARGANELKKFEDELKASGANAAGFPIQSYAATDVANAFKSIRSHFPASTHALRVAVYNAGNGVWKPFLQITPEDVAAVSQTNFEGAFAFAHEVISTFKDNSIDETGKRGAFIITGATASIRGNLTTSAVSAGKHAMRALSQSLAKEFGKDNIHVSHAIIDGVILTSQGKGRRNDPEWEKNEDIRLNPDSIATAYLYLAHQHRSAWTWELDLRPAHEKW